MVKSWILPLKCNYKLQTVIKGEPLLLEVTVSASPRGVYEHGHIQLPTEWGQSCQWSWGLLAVTCFNIYYVHRKCWLLGTGSVPKVTASKGCAPKELRQVSWDPDLQLGKFWQKTRNETAEFAGVTILASCPWGESDSESSFDFFLIFYVDDKLSFRTPRAR